MQNKISEFVPWVELLAQQIIYANIPVFSQTNVLKALRKRFYLWHILRKSFVTGHLSGAYPLRLVVCNCYG